MREIKFRAWLPKPKMMVYEMEQDSDLMDIITDHNYKNGNYILMQYTGLKDKNGKEIYEGDIVYVASEDENASIEWDNETARFILSFDDWFADFDNYYGKDLEVICNIYDNPDLIKE